MTKLLERPPELWAKTGVLPRPDEAPELVDTRIPQTPRRSMGRLVWLLVLAVVAVVGSVVIMNAVSEDPVSTPTVETEIAPPYAASVAAWNEFLAMQAAVDTSPPYAASVAVWNEFLAMQAAAVDTNPPYAASVAAWENFLAMQAAAEAVKQLPYASSIAAWNEFLEFGA